MDAGRLERLKLAVALATVYLVWGSTYLAIAVADRSLPPLLMLSVRFLIAGGLLYAWSAWRGDLAAERPGRRQWGAAAVVGSCCSSSTPAASRSAEQRVADRPGRAAASRACRCSRRCSTAPSSAIRLPLGAVAGIAAGLLGVGLLVGPGGRSRPGRHRRPARRLVRLGGGLGLRARRAAPAATVPLRGDADALRRRDARRRRHRRRASCLPGPARRDLAGVARRLRLPRRLRLDRRFTAFGWLSGTCRSRCSRPTRT